MQQHIFLFTLLLGGLFSLAFADAREDMLEKPKRKAIDQEYKHEKGASQGKNQIRSDLKKQIYQEE